MKLEFEPGDCVKLVVGHNCKTVLLQTEHDGPVEFMVALPDYIGVTAGEKPSTTINGLHECALDLTEFPYQCLRVDFYDEGEDGQRTEMGTCAGETPFAEIRIERLPISGTVAD